MKARLMQALSALMIIGSLFLATAAPYDEPDLDGPSYQVNACLVACAPAVAAAPYDEPDLDGPYARAIDACSISCAPFVVATPYDEPDLDSPSTRFVIVAVLYLTLALAWGAAALRQRRNATFA